MKRIIFICLLIFLLLSLIDEILFAEEHNVGNGWYEYYNSNGSLDFDTFYAKWDEVPGSYYIYMESYTYDHSVKSMLYKTVGGLEAMFDEKRRNDVRFTLEKGKSRLVLIFSPWNYANAKENDWIPLGQKRFNYNEAIERWNFMMGNMK